MGAAKWKISVNDTVLGHFAAKTAEKAVDRAWENNLPYFEYPLGTVYTAEKSGIKEEVCR